MLTTVNQRAMRELIHHYKHGLEATLRMTTQLWDINVVFQGTRAHTVGRTITLPNVDIFALNVEITDEAVEEARAYFTALVGYAWREAGLIVESDSKLSASFEANQGSLANVIRSVLDEIRAEYRFGQRGKGIAEAIEYTREQWVWPRVARQQEAACINGNPDLVHQMLHGLQCVMKHQEYGTHSLWKSLLDEVKTFVERNLEDLESAHDTLKMNAEDSAARLGEIVVRMLARWKAEWDTVSSWIVGRQVKTLSDTWGPSSDECLPDEASDAVSGLDQVKGEEELKTSEGISPFLLVTYGLQPFQLQALPFSDGFVRRVDVLPTTKEEWEALEPLQRGETRTLVALPPDLETERQLNKAMAALMQGLMSIGKAIAEEAEQKLADAEHHISKLPEDQRPYLVYTTANDRFVTTETGSLERYHELQSIALRHVGIVKRRLQTLLRIRTRDRWRRNQPEGDCLDEDAMAAVAMAPKMPNAALTPFKVKTERDTLCETIVGVLVDVSGSMGGRKLELAMEAGLCFAEAFDLAKIKFGMWGFTSDDHLWRQTCQDLVTQCKGQGLTQSQIEERINLYGRFGALHIETVKSFTDPWFATKQRLPSIGYVQHANYDADSVQWVAKQLLAQKAKRRVLFVLSDGLPDTSEPDIQVARQRRHLSDVVRSMIARKVEIVGVGICDRSVELYYPHAVVIQHADDLPRVVMAEMDHLLLRSRSR